MVIASSRSLSFNFIPWFCMKRLRTWPNKGENRQRQHTILYLNSGYCMSSTLWSVRISSIPPRAMHWNGRGFCGHDCALLPRTKPFSPKQPDHERQSVQVPNTMNTTPAEASISINFKCCPDVRWDGSWWKDMMKRCLQPREAARTPHRKALLSEFGSVRCKLQTVWVWRNRSFWAILIPLNLSLVQTDGQSQHETLVWECRAWCKPTLGPCSAVTWAHF